MRIQPVLVSLCVASVSLAAGLPTAHAKNDKIHYQAQVLRTSYGIPHVRATDWGSLGYGYGYVFAQDNFCILARDVLVATGAQARYFGAGPGSSNLISDWTYAMVNSDARVNPTWGSLDRDTRDLMQGYADGYNRYCAKRARTRARPNAAVRRGSGRSPALTSTRFPE